MAARVARERRREAAEWMHRAFGSRGISPFPRGAAQRGRERCRDTTNVATASAETIFKGVQLPEAACLKDPTPILHLQACLLLLAATTSTELRD